MTFSRSTRWLCYTAAAATMMTAVHAHAADAAPAAKPAPPAASSPDEEFDGDAEGSKIAKKASEALGLEFVGYMRSGAYYANHDLPKGHYGLGELGYNRFGNEGDTYLEFGIGKTWKSAGTSVGVYWMPYIYNAQCCSVKGTQQAYAELAGLGFAPALKFWGGQRYHRVQDIHIIDNWLMEDGDNFGAGVDGIQVGNKLGTLNIAAYTEGTIDNSTTTSNARRLNLQWRDIPFTDGGTLNFTAGLVHGDFQDKRTGTALGALYNQKLGESTANALFLQGSNGHADLRGKFYALNGQKTSTVGDAFVCTVTPNPDGSCPVARIAANPATVTSTVYNPGARQWRLVDSLTWQVGKLGGQAMAGYQGQRPEGSADTTHNFAIGGQVSYGVARNVKLYADMNLATLKTGDAATQRLHKETLGVALAPNTKFWTRPELRLYLTHVGGNDAVREAGVFNGRSSATLAGLQIEAWWD